MNLRRALSEQRVSSKLGARAAANQNSARRRREYSEPFLGFARRAQLINDIATGRRVDSIGRPVTFGGFNGRRRRKCPPIDRLAPSHQVARRSTNERRRNRLPNLAQQTAARTQAQDNDSAARATLGPVTRLTWRRRPDTIGGATRNCWLCASQNGSP